jgi:hypothetical protein
MLRGRKQARAAGIEELAQRLAKGAAVPPEEIEAVLERTGCDEAMLQERIDCLERRAELLAKVSSGNRAKAKADKLNAEIEAAYGKVQAAQAEYGALRAKHDEPLMILGSDIRAGEMAFNALLAPENLTPADRQRLEVATAKVSEASRALSETRSSLRDLRLSLENAERVAADAVEQARLNKSNGDIQAHKQRSENAVAARKARLVAAEAELPRLQAAAEQAEAAVAAIEDELRR